MYDTAAIACQQTRYAKGHALGGAKGAKGADRYFLGLARKENRHKLYLSRPTQSSSSLRNARVIASSKRASV